MVQFRGVKGWMSAFAVCAFSLAIAGCSTTGTASKGGDTEATVALESMVPLPVAAKKLTIQSRHVYEQAAAGVQYRYAGDTVYHVDVFVYPLKEEQKQFLIEGNERALVVDEFSRFRGELDYAVQQGWYQAVKPIDEAIRSWAMEFQVNGEAHDASFLVADGEYRIRKDDQELASFLALSEFNGYFVKIRLTHPDYPGLPGEMKAFSKFLFEHLYNTKPQLPGISFEHDGVKTSVICLPGESILECMARGLRDIKTLEKDAEKESESVAGAS